MQKQASQTYISLLLNGFFAGGLLQDSGSTRWRRGSDLRCRIVAAEAVRAGLSPYFIMEIFGRRISFWIQQ